MKIKHKLIIPDKYNIEESLQLAEEYNCGFEYNDFFSPALLDDTTRLRDTIQFYNTLGKLPEYCTMHGAFLDITVFSEDARIREVSDYRVEQSLDIAQKLGAKAVIFHTNYIPTFHMESYRNQFVKSNIEYWSKKLHKYPDLNIYMENMFDMDCILLARLAEGLKGEDNFGVCFDYAHAHVFGDKTQIDSFVTGLAAYVKHLHINDNDCNADLHLALGEGEIDWYHFCKQYKRFFSEASVLLEMRGTEKIRKSLEFIDSLE